MRLAAKTVTNMTGLKFIREKKEVMRFSVVTKELKIIQFNQQQWHVLAFNQWQ